MLSFTKSCLAGKKLVLVTGLLLILPLNIFSQQNFWEQTNGPYGAFALSLACDSSGGIYAGTMTQGLYKSNDGGYTWSRIGLNGKIVNTILAFTNQIIFVGTDDGFYQTSDSGSNWIKNNLTSTANIFCKTLNGSILLGTNQQIYRSSDFGITWQNTTGNIPNVMVTSLTFDSSGYLYAAAGNKGILISNNDGILSWIQSNIGLTFIRSCYQGCFCKRKDNIFTYVASPTNYISSLAGVYISTDNGTSWTQKSNLFPISQFAVNQEGYLLAGVYYDYSGFNSYNIGVYYSSDLGSSWSQLPNQNNFDVRTLLTMPDGYIISGNYYSGLFLSEDDGNSWEEINTGINNSDITDIYAAPSGSIFCSRFSLDYSHGGVYRSRDQGNSWTKLNTGNNDPNVRAFFSDNQGNIYAGDIDIYRSSDDGEYWLNVSSGAGLINCFVQSPNGTLFAGTDGYGIFRSTNNGLTWNESNSGLTNLTIFTLTVSDLGTILAGSFEGIIFRSTNDGINWESINTLHNSTVLSLYKTTDNIIFVGLNADFNDCLLKSSDDGITWERVTPFPRARITDITENTLGDIFVACRYEGVYRSLDKGNSVFTK